jgi:hypothetical protein
MNMYLALCASVFISFLTTVFLRWLCYFFTFFFKYQIAGERAHGQRPSPLCLRARGRHFRASGVAFVCVFFFWRTHIPSFYADYVTFSPFSSSFRQQASMHMDSVLFRCVCERAGVIYMYLALRASFFFFWRTHVPCFLLWLYYFLTFFFKFQRAGEHAHKRRLSLLYLRARGRH